MMKRNKEDMDSGVLEGDYQILVATGVFAGQINV
jgi:hypothetical protein